MPHAIWGQGKKRKALYRMSAVTQSFGGLQGIRSRPILGRLGAMTKEQLLAEIEDSRRNDRDL
jgi:hypothetical protein